MTKYQIKKEVKGALYCNRVTCKLFKELRIFTKVVEYITDYLEMLFRRCVIQSSYISKYVNRLKIEKPHVILCSFNWDRTKEGFEYWMNMYSIILFFYNENYE